MSIPNPAAAIEQEVTAPVEEPSMDSQASTLPDEVIQLPVMQALISGQPGAVSEDMKTGPETPFGQVVAKHGATMQQAGFGFYRSNDGSLGVIFNQLHVNPQDIVEADNNGTLLEIAPPVSDVESGLLSDPNSNPVLGEGQVPPGTAMASGGGGPAQGGVPPAQNQALANKRRSNLQPKGPTDQARPGAGKILNEILKPVV